MRECVYVNVFVCVIVRLWAVGWPYLVVPESQMARYMSQCLTGCVCVCVRVCVCACVYISGSLEHDITS